MDFISGSIIGGLIYDYLKMGLSTYGDIVKVALKDSVLDDREKELITIDLENTSDNDRSTKENLENYFETKAENTKEIVNKYKIGTQNNQTNNSGRNTITGEGSTYIENQMVYNTSEQKEESKKH